MTHTEKLSELTARIREALPRLNEPEEGDLIWYNGHIYNLHYTTHGEDDIELQQPDGLMYIGFMEEDFKEHFSVGEMVVVVMPMLNDVLGYLASISINHTINSAGSIFREYDYEAKYAGEWDLTKPYLKDQSEELIDYLWNLK